MQGTQTAAGNTLLLGQEHPHLSECPGQTGVICGGKSTKVVYLKSLILPIFVIHVVQEEI